MGSKISKRKFIARRAISTGRSANGAGNSLFVRWGKKIRWENRVKAVCKPCWELKYRPYGPLVEQFPLRTNRDERSCRIFGHDCPVFHIAEPFTETRELRHISRSIPRSVQFRVLKRENQICRQCGKSVQDTDVEFDHIIPWSKGGSSDEANVRLLCRACNRKRQANFESEFLVESVRDHLVEPLDLVVVRWLKVVAGFGHEFVSQVASIPTAADYAHGLNGGIVGEPEVHAAKCYAELNELMRAKRPADLTAKAFQALKTRWGVRDGSICTLRAASKQHGCDITELVDGERGILKRLGFIVRSDAKTCKSWQKL